MKACEMGLRPVIAALQGRYSLHAEHPKIENAIAERFTNVDSAVARASELINAGYSPMIWSPLSLERRQRTCSRKGMAGRKRISEHIGYQLAQNFPCSE